MKECLICLHEDRQEIEKAILRGESYYKVCHDFDIEHADLIKHCKQHIRIDGFTEVESHVLTKSKAREMHLLQEAALSCFLTMKSLEKVIHKQIAMDNIRGITKNVVELYLGSGAEMRQQIDSMFKNLQIVTGEGNTSSQLAELVAVLNTSMTTNADRLIQEQNDEDSEIDTDEILDVDGYEDPEMKVE